MVSKWGKTAVGDTIRGGEGTLFWKIPPQKAWSRKSRYTWTSYQKLGGGARVIFVLIGVPNVREGGDLTKRKVRVLKATERLRTGRGPKSKALPVSEGNTAF